MNALTRFSCALLLFAAVGACGSGNVGTEGDGAATPDAEAADASTWIRVTGGTFAAGRTDPQQVTVSDFWIMRSEVTVQMYRDCVDSADCSPPGTGNNCSWEVAGRANHPVNCVSWQQMRDYCAWVDGRLPSDMEWEYAARSQGLDQRYPWGEQDPDCSRAVYSDCTCEGHSCPVCTHPAGNTDQGVCNLAGNVYEWVEDCWHWDLIGVPADGTAWTTDCLGEERNLRGGSFDNASSILFATFRTGYDPEGQAFDLGGRCARNVP